MSSKSLSSATKYAIYGGIFGLCFPLVGTVIQCIEVHGGVSAEGIVDVQSNTPLLWIIDSAPFILGFFAFLIGQRIDQLKQRNRELARSREVIRSSEQLAALGHLTAGIAHELKNPLNFVVNFAEGSRDLVDDAQGIVDKNKSKMDPADHDELQALMNDLKENAADIQKNGLAASRIINTMMDHTREAESHFKLSDINGLISENVNLAFHSYRASNPGLNVFFDLNLAPELPKVNINPHNIGRVLLNIINNALYSVRKKTELEEEGYEPRIDISTYSEDNMISIELLDNGMGISSSLLSEIFAPFYTTKPTGQGNSGLGLSISKEIVEVEHAGQLSVNSREGQYARFTIKLPLT